MSAFVANVLYVCLQYVQCMFVLYVSSHVLFLLVMLVFTVQVAVEMPEQLSHQLIS